MRLRPAVRLRGRLTLPGDKSISHRAAIIAALAGGQSVLKNFSTSQDCTATLRCLTQLGVNLETSDGVVTIPGVGPVGLAKPIAELNCGNSGSTMRMLAGVLAGHDFTSTLTGDESLLARPMRRIIDPLEQMGARVSSKESKPPLTITGTSQLRAIKYNSTVASAQVKTCVLLAGLQANGDTSFIEQRATRDHTERLLKFFQVPLDQTTTAQGYLQTKLTGPAQPIWQELQIPGDISSAAFFVAAAGLLSGSELEIDEVGLNPTRTKFISLFQLLGLAVRYEPRGEFGGEPVGRISVSADSAGHQPSFQSANRLPADDVPSLIDELPLVAVVGSQLPGGIIVRGATELRYKESDRIAATVTNLRAMGAAVDEFEDGFAVSGPQKLHGAALRSYGDHRIAMSFTVAAMFAEGESELDDPECVGVSFPEFFALLESIAER